MIPPASPSMRSAAGGTAWVAPAIRKPVVCLSPPTAAAVTALGYAYGNANCRRWPTNLAWPSPSAICRPAPANGTGSSIVCSHSSHSWRGKPLVNYQTIVQLIGATTTRTALKVQCAIDDARYPAGVKVSDAEMADLKLTPHAFHGEWNYTS